MPRYSGLRTEIIINITFLMAAALLFVGFFLLRLTEQELTAQRIKSVTGAVELVSRALSSGLTPPNSNKDHLVRQAAELLRNSSLLWPMEGWELVDGELAPLAKNGFKPDRAELQQAMLALEPIVHVNYSASWIPVRMVGESIAITVPIRWGDRFVGALQVKASLSDVQRRVSTARNWMLLYAGVYGIFLVLFGVWFLGRTLLRPVRRLQELTRRVAAGDLEASLPIDGPREIAELAGSFNSMTTALRENQGEMEAHIDALQRTNEELARTRDDLVRSEKMASVGHLAAGMAHEIGNPLGALTGYLGLLRAELPPGRQQEIAGCGLAEAERIERLIRDLLDYASPSLDQSEKVDPGSVLIEATEMLTIQGALADRKLENALPPILPTVWVVRHKLLQVFVNLIINARDAGKAGQVIRIAGSAKEKQVWVSVTDAGSGIDPQLLPQLFDPFFTTKPPGKGRGLGLSVCHRIVAEAGGRIDVRSTPGEGSTFTVWLRQAESEDGV